MADTGQMTNEAASLQLEEGLRTIRKSKAFIFLFIIAVVLSYAATDIQERQLICVIEQTSCEGLPDPCRLRIAAGLLSLWGLVFFYALGIQTASTPAADACAEKRNRVGSFAGLLSLVAGSLRLWAVLNECGSAASGTQSEEEEIEDDEFII